MERKREDGYYWLVPREHGNGIAITIGRHEYSAKNYDGNFPWTMFYSTAIWSDWDIERNWVIGDFIAPLNGPEKQ
jgi:hypothetical protein